MSPALSGESSRTPTRAMSRLPVGPPSLSLYRQRPLNRFGRMTGGYETGRILSRNGKSYNANFGGFLDRRAGTLLSRL